MENSTLLSKLESQIYNRNHKLTKAEAHDYILYHLAISVEKISRNIKKLYGTDRKLVYSSTMKHESNNYFETDAAKTDKTPQYFDEDDN